MRWRSMTRGLRSIISTWACRVSRTVSLEIPGGSGVTVVKTLLLDMLLIIHKLGDVTDDVDFVGGERLVSKGLTDSKESDGEGDG